MKIKDIVELAAELVGEPEVLTTNSFTGEEREEQENGVLEKNLELLVRCANLSLSVVATDKFELKNKEVIFSETGEIKFDEFNKKVYQIMSVKKNGAKVDYRVYPSLIDCFTKGKFEITYKYLPGYYELNDTINDFNNVPIRLLAYFTASEYCYISGDFDDASVWEQRYKETLQNLTNLKGKSVPERSWF